MNKAAGQARKRPALFAFATLGVVGLAGVCAAVAGLQGTETAKGIVGRGRGRGHGKAAGRSQGDAQGGYWGVALGLFPNLAGRLDLPYPPTVGELKRLGAQDVLLPVTWNLDDVTSHRIRRAANTPSDDDLRQLMRHARRQGLGVVLMPLLQVRAGDPKDWRGHLRPASQARWWSAYRAWILHYARIAEDERVRLLAIGSELSAMQGRDHAYEWRRLASDVRRAFGGPLAYVSNHDALQHTGPFAFVDVVGVNAYFPLTTELEPTSAELAERWREIGGRLRRLKARLNKPLVIFELGYPSADGGARRPWSYTHGGPLDLEEQRQAYAAAVYALGPAEWLDGLFFWLWFGQGGPHDRSHTPRNKPAQAELERFLGSRTGTAPRARSRARPQ